MPLAGRVSAPSRASVALPVRKLSQAVTSGSRLTVVNTPLKACCTDTSMPEQKTMATGRAKASPVAMAPAPSPRPGAVAATATPTTASSAASTRPGRIGCGADGPSPRRSTSNALTDWPPIMAMRKAVTPTSGTA